MQSLARCGVQSISLLEEKIDPVEEGPSSRQITKQATHFSPAPNAFYYNPNAKLKIVHKMTAAALGSGRKGKKLTIETVGESLCGSQRCLKLQGADVKGPIASQRYELEVFSPKKTDDAITDVINNTYSSPDRKQARDTLKFAHAALFISGFTTIFDVVYRSGFARKPYVFSSDACGNPYNELAAEAEVEVIVYPREKYKIEINLPILSKKLEEESYKGKTKLTEEDDEFEVKLSVEDKPVKLEHNLYKVYKFISDANYAVEAISSLFSASPIKAGFFYEGEARFLYGSIEFEWQWVEQGQNNVALEYDIQASLVIADIECSFRYGFVAFGLELYAHFTINGKSSIFVSKKESIKLANEEQSRDGQLLRIPSKGEIDFSLGLT